MWECAAREFKNREDVHMKPAGITEGRTAVFWAGLAAALVLGIVRPASAQMLEGTLSGTFAGFGTADAMTTGKERTVLALTRMD